MNLRGLDPGFKANRLFAFSVHPSLSGQDFVQRVATLGRTREELEALPRHRVRIGGRGGAHERHRVRERRAVSQAAG
jgi:hypothetical protein